MPDLRRRNCRRCGRHDSEVGPISWAGNCVQCWPGVLEANARSISAKSGPQYLHQVRRQFMAAHRALLDAERASA